MPRSDDTAVVDTIASRTVDAALVLGRPEGVSMPASRWPTTPQWTVYSPAGMVWSG
ncbi:hypothetical protein [Euzebya tangerina]|uniref:hypothetical protein n=1 Tax=Euzebya tangerina TaxID=591198 RepID=UPI0013C2F863|nr:hypothetical protein [Euzebya tangerina]